MLGPQENLLGAGVDRKFRRTLLRARRFIARRAPVRMIPLVTALTLALSASAGAAVAAVPANIMISGCSSTANKLRYDCTFETDVVTRVTIQWNDGTTVRSAPPSAPGFTHQFRLVGMRAGVAVNWWAFADSAVLTPGMTVSGSFVTQPLTGTQQAALTIIPAAGGYHVQSVLFPADCGSGTGNQMLFIADAGGAVVWYEDPAPVTGGGPIVALNVTERGTILAIHGGDIVEYTLEGDLVSYFQAGIDFTDPLHHDVFRRDSRLFALHQMWVPTSVGMQQYDGVTVFDSTGLVRQWDSSALYDPAADCYALNDCMHTNSLWVGPDGSWTMSQRTPGRVIQIDGDPTSATYGQLVWELDGQGGTGDFAIDSSVTADLTFEGQHNVQFLPNGKLLMFDNEFSPTTGLGAPTGSPIRGLEIQFVGETALITHEYDTGMAGAGCQTRGSAFKVEGPDGNVLTTCADNNTIQEIDATPTVLWQANTACTGAVPIVGQPYRAIPIELP